MLETAVLDPPSATRPRDPFRLVSSVEANARVVLGAYTLLYAFGFWVSASHTAFRFDEIFTFEIAQLPRIGDIWHVLRQGIELNPPLVFWITWILHKLFGGGPVISRLPAAFGFWGMTICLYHFVRRRTRPVYGLFAAVFPLLTFAADYRLLARAYGLELGFAALALLCWQLAVDGVCRRVTLFGLTFGIAAAISSHYYATYIVGALLIGELVRTYITKRVDYACIAAIAFGAVPLLAFRPLFGAVALGTKHFWMSSPKAEILLKCYGTILAPALLIALPLLVYLAVSRPVDRSAIHPNHGLYLWEGVAAGTLAAMPFAVFVAAFFIHLGFLDRYVILAVPGVSILLLCALYQLSGGSAASAGFLLRTAVWTCLLPWWIWQIATMMAAPAPSKTVSLDAINPSRKDLPVVVADDNSFLQDWLYLAGTRKQQFFALIDYQAAAQYTDNDTAQRSMAEGRRWWPIPAIDYKTFVAQHPVFLLARLSIHSDWIAQKLLADGAEVQLLEIHRELGFVSPETQIFLVRCKPSNMR